MTFRNSIGKSKSLDFNQQRVDVTSPVNFDDYDIGLPLAKRVEKFWDWFVENEKEISDMVCHGTQNEAEDFIAFIQNGTALISDNINFNSGGDYEFSFSVEGWPDLFLIFPYVISCMPESLRLKWKFAPFNRGTDTPFGLRMYGKYIDSSRIMVRASYIEENDNFSISYYESNINMLPKDESDNAMWIILENTLSEGVSYKYIEDIEPTSKPEEGMIPLPDLRKYIKKSVEAQGRQFFDNPQEVYNTYRLRLEKSDELRFDIIIGSTCLKSIIDDFYNDSTEILDHVNSFGAQALFIVFSHACENDLNDYVGLRHDIEDRISAEILKPMNIGQVIGGATGSCNSYIDLLVFDLNAFVNAVRTLLEQYPAYSFYLSDFKRDSGLIQLTGAASCTYQ